MVRCLINDKSYQSARNQTHHISDTVIEQKHNCKRDAKEYNEKLKLTSREQTDNAWL